MLNPPKRIIFYYLSAFSNTGGIEKFNQCFIKALAKMQEKGVAAGRVISVYDKTADERYTENLSIKGFGKQKGKSALSVLRSAFRTDVLILGHSNLLLIGLLAKILNPRCRMILIAHGIETWRKFSFIEQLAIKRCELILAVSTYTKNQIVLRNGIDAKKIFIFPNTLDPYFQVPDKFQRPDYLMERYGLKPTHKIIFTMARLFWSEQNKGYDKIISTLPRILENHPDVIYILGGKFDKRERERIDSLINLYGVKDKVILAGYIDDKEKADHYLLADVFVLPSRKEGFGIVFLEALACGTPVIGGNQDGTVDALQNGSLGYLINPKSENDIYKSIIESLMEDNKTDGKKRQQSILENYHFNSFVKRLNNVLQA